MRIRRISQAFAVAGVVTLAVVGHTVVDSSAFAESAATSTASACPSVGQNWSADGPFAVTEEASGVGHTVFRPTDLGGQGCGKHPVVLWGNGTGATPKAYAGLLRHLASHGFIVAAADTKSAGNGTAMLAGLDYLTSENGKAGSAYAGKVDLDKVGVTGHSQGGGGAIVAGADPRIDTTVPIQPGPQGSIAKLTTPMFILGGQFDFIVVPALLVIPRYTSAGHIPAIYAELRGKGHFEPVGDGGKFRGPITAWLRYQLMGDEQAKGEFFGPKCGNCSSPFLWSDFRRNAKAAQI
ncbi:poly(ethylene terephthalate) hydrolase family protein [Actinokineospora iranica]|uniref:Chlorophyllase enzyme n=1 Tax=Actinokineospora iranica TaxID=1271860 RepID=A0A1G6ZDC6_9PSEU|nr:acetylxylan esterase [Actinokineospora iranica]SDE00147.1 Chlorophyllase enzyme [Actinokineospora iranica]